MAALLLPDEQNLAVTWFAALSAGVCGGTIESTLAVSTRQAEYGSKDENWTPSEIEKIYLADGRESPITAPRPPPPTARR